MDNEKFIEIAVKMILKYEANMFCKTLTEEDICILKSENKYNNTLYRLVAYASSTRYYVFKYNSIEKEFYLNVFDSVMDTVVPAQDILNLLEKQPCNAKTDEEITVTTSNVIDDNKMDNKKFIKAAKKAICKYAADVFEETITEDDIHITEFEGKFYMPYRLTACVGYNHYEIEYYDDLDEEFYINIFANLINVTFSERVVLNLIKGNENE